MNLSFLFISYIYVLFFVNSSETIITSDSDLYEVAVLGVCQVEPGLAGLVRQDVVEDAGGHLEVHTVQVTCLVGGQGQLRHQVLGHERVHLQITRVKLLHLRGEREGRSG